LYFIKRELKECNPQVVELEYNYLIFGSFLAQTKDKIDCKTEALKMAGKEP